ncbi:hypothetical protein JCM19233_670 [Vibrio astriarenae]|nr:hypothetical protein JCM19233_670 [Vibrio sp. C7]
MFLTSLYKSLKVRGAACALTLLSVWFSTASWANHALFFPFVDTQQSLGVMSDVFEDEYTFECSETDEQWRYCAEFVYYQTSVFAYFYESAGVIKRAELEVEPSMNHLAQVQYNLRRDGFEVSSVSHSGEVFDVKKQLKMVSPSDVDKALIEFINSHSPSEPITLVWNKYDNQSDARAVVAYDVLMLQLTFTRE